MSVNSQQLPANNFLFSASSASSVVKYYFPCHSVHSVVKLSVPIHRDSRALAVKNGSTLDKYGTTLDKNGATLAHFGKGLDKFGHAKNTKIAVFSTESAIHPKKKNNQRQSAQSEI